MIKCILGLALALLASLPLRAQQDEEVLFTVGAEPVTVGEFRYIYTKTNADNADFSRESVMEYLDLYERFKLKVARARTMGLDTIVALQTELEGYRKQLADNYLIDREVTDTLVRQLYARQAEDVDFSHILFKIPSDDPADTLRVYERAMDVRKQLTADNFAQMATVSEDTYSKDKGGRIGFISAPLPRGLHRLERGLWATPAGSVGGPVRTAAGYHLYLVHATRPAFGEVEIAHILIRKPAPPEGGDAGAANDTAIASARDKANRARQALSGGEDFGSAASEYSEDDDTKNQDGYIGFFGINRYNKDFEQAAFALTEDGEVSEVIESPVGFHILRRISRRGVQPLDEQRPLLEVAVKQDDRYAEAKQAMIDRLRLRYNTQVMEDNFAGFAASLDSTFFDPAATFATAGDTQPLLTIGDRSLTVSDFDAYLTRNARLRASLQRRLDPAGAARELYRRWTDEQVEAYAEAQLEEQFPEFKALMREYREGILLFEATKLEVWDKAGEDSLGLNAYFADHRADYTSAHVPR